VINYFNTILLLLIGCLAYGQQPISNLKQFEIFGEAQGTTYQISYYHDAAIISKNSLDSIFQVIDQSMSLYKKDSKINTFNQSKDKFMLLDNHMKAVVKKSFRFYKESKGKFDVTVKPLVSLWGFGPEKTKVIPDSALVRETLKDVGMEKLVLKGNKLIKKVPNIQLDLNGIAQGYTVDVIYEYLKKHAVGSFLIEVGGEIRTRGLKPNQEEYRILIARPDSMNQGSNYVVGLKNKSITTAGSYENFRTVGNYKFSHHMDPNTGYPLKSTIISATVITESAIDADGYDNVIMAMEPKEAIAFANKKNKMDIYLIYLDGAEIKEAYSKGFEKYIRIYK